MLLRVMFVFLGAALLTGVCFAIEAVRQEGGAVFLFTFRFGGQLLFSVAFWGRQCCVFSVDV